MAKNDIEAIYPLSPMQAGMLFHTLYAPASGIYFEQLDCTLHGELNRSAFQQAWQQAVERYAVLRTLFMWERRDKPLQVVRRQVKLPWTEYDWRNMLPDEQQRQLESFLQADRRQGFDLAKAPLMRLVLIRLAEHSYHFIWSFHHLLLDGWSASRLFNEVFTLYEARCRGEDLPLAADRPYRDYIAWLQQQDLGQAETYWRQTLRGFTTPTRLFFDRLPGSGSSPEHEYAEQQVQLSPAATTALQALARQYQVTLNTLVQGAWAILLSRYSGEADVLFGAVVSGRPADLSGVETMMGLFINTLPVRVTVSPQITLAAWLKTLQTRQIEARHYEYSPLAQVQGWSEVARGQALFESILIFENYPVSQPSSAQGQHITIRNVHFFEKTNYPLTIIVEPGPALWLRFSYDSDYFDHAAISRILGHFQTLLEGMVDQPAARLSDLSILTAAEQRQLLVEWNNTAADYPQEQCLHHLFEARVAQIPEANALTYQSETLTYGELNRRANQLAHYLRAQGIGPEVIVGLCVERSLEMVVGLLGILKASAAYLPLDPTYPPDRLAWMLADTQTPLLLTQQRLIKKLPRHSARLVCLDRDWPTITQHSADNPAGEVTPQNLAYVLFTSGSTGQPKGVAIEHHSPVALVAWAGQIFTADDLAGVLASTSINFDLSVFELFVPLSWGGRVILVENALHLPTLPAAHQVTLVNTVPSAMTELLRLGDLPLSVRTVNLAGEPLRPELVQQLYRQKSVQRVFDLYGPSEDTTYSTFALRSSQGPATIGRPVANTQVYLLDAQLQPVPIGVPGELYLGGAGLARGYLNRPGLTAEKFIPNPFSSAANGQRPIATEEVPTFNGLPSVVGSRLYKTGDLARYLPDGNIEFLGRLDHQIKIRGFRVELGEIEAALRRHPAVREAVMLFRSNQDGSDQKQLVAYLVTHPGDRPRNSDLRNFLKQTLPDYMIPSSFVFLAALPLTPNGKIDRKALPAPDSARPEVSESYTLPRYPTEEMLATIWAEILGLERVGIHDDFFELGGHSLLATQLVLRVREVFQVELSLREFFTTATVAGLAQAIDLTRRAGPAATAPSIDFKAEAVLDPAIRPPAVPPLPAPPAHPASILLTGATGFLGAFLLYELLQQTSAHIYCLVRAADAEAGRQKIYRNFETYLLHHPHLTTRVIPVVGDLAQPYLGLSTSEFQHLAGQLDAIYHNGAVVNFVYPYHKLKPANVLGTQEVLRLATRLKAIPVHYVSTISVFDSLGYLQKQLIREQDEVGHSDSLLFGYAQSKWVAEKLVVAARERGLPVSIYRPGTVVGHSQTGAWNTDDYLCRFIKGCIQLGEMPDLDEITRLTPVDFVSRAIIYLSLRSQSWGQVFHTLTPHRLPLGRLAEWLAAFGYPVQQTPYKQWLNLLMKQVGHSTENALYSLLPFYIERAPGEAMLTMPELFTQERAPEFGSENLTNALAGSDLTCPVVDAERFGVYLSYFIRRGFLPPPSK